jgi:hypothetical protein
MTSSRDKLLRQLADRKWHAASDLGATVHRHGIATWIRLLRLGGHEIEERTRDDDAMEYRLAAAADPE